MAKIRITMLLLCFLASTASISRAADTISVNQTLTGDQTIVSSGGNFVLGFFNPVTSNSSSRYYIGIWYSLNKVRNQTIVWVANRETPVSDKNSASLQILNGNLVLLDESQRVIWSTDLNSTSSNVVAVLRDDGNLVLRDGARANSSFLWESFDNPAHTWLPGGKIAYDKRTRKKMLLTSWKNSEDPAPGLFTLELDPNGKQYIINWNGTQQYWTSGQWNGQIFSLVPEMRLNYIYNFSYVDNVNESYFTYSLYNPSLISRFIMDVSGQIKQLSLLDNDNWNLFWSQPRQQCEVYAYCGAFGACNQNSLPFCNCLPGFKHKSDSDWDLNDYSNGCVRQFDLQCESSGVANASSLNSNGKKDKFYMSPYMKLLDPSQTPSVASSRECESACSNNCSCSAYAYDDNSCSIWNGDLFNLQQLSQGDSNGRTVYIKLSASSTVFAGAKKVKTVTIVAIVVSAVAVALVLSIIFALMWRQRRKTSGSSKTMEGSLIAFAYKDLQSATKNFSEKLGGGGFGSVFKGSLPDSSIIAVKKLESISQGEKQFRTEVSTIGTVQHVNLVRLRGFCSEGDKRLLVYDYMPNGSLDSHLFKARGSNHPLDWKARYQIALGIARGLSYLHEKCRDCIIHCDIKPENILLDSELCPKVADFGLAKLVGRDFSRVLTTMRGTRGYLAPEWISGVAITSKADVYSYGMMLFELVSGRRNSESSSNDGRVRFFPTLAADVTVNGGDLLDILDPVLDRRADGSELSKVCRVACWCVQDDENARPSMGQVVQILEGLMDVNLPQVPRSLRLFVESEEHIVFFTDDSSTGREDTSRTRSDGSKNSEPFSLEN